MIKIPNILHKGVLLPVFKAVFPPPKDATISLPKYKIKFYIEDSQDRIQSMIYYFNEYEPAVTDIVLKNLSENGSFFDIGASIGYFSLIGARMVGQGGSVHAFEPLPKNYALFEKNIKLNNLTNITVNRMIVSDKSGDATFYPPNNPHEWGTGSVLGGNKDEAFKVPSISLADYIELKKIERVDLIKIDVEGSEMKVIKGLAPVIKEIGYPKIICEANSGWLRLAGVTPQSLIEELRALRYEIRIIGRRGIGRLDERRLPPLFNVFATPII